MPVLLLFFRQVKSALWQAPLGVLAIKQVYKPTKITAESSHLVALGGDFYSLINGVFLICDWKLYAPL